MVAVVLIYVLNIKYLSFSILGSYTHCTVNCTLFKIVLFV